MGETITLPNGRSFNVVGGARAAPTAAKRKAHRQIPKPLDGAPVSQGTLSLSVVPPSVNALFFNRPKGKGRGLTLAYRNWRAFADRELRDQPPWHVPGRVEVRIYLPAVTRGDADNRIKATLDALVCAGRIEDDRNVVKVGAEFSTLEETRILIQGRPA
jgi:Holliday junction resolvase RusA-like endonuclease